MAAVTITLTDQQVSLAQAMADKEGFSGIEPYLQMFLTERLAGQESGGEDFGAPDHLRVSSIAHLKGLVREGLDSPAGEMTHADFDQMRQEFIADHGISRAV